MAEQLQRKKLENEAAIVEQAKTDDQAFAILYEFYFPKIYGYIFKRVGNHHLAEDLVSVTFIKVFSNIKKYRFQGASFGAWVYRIATNSLTDHFRQSGRRPEADLEEHTQIMDQTPGVEAMMQSGEERELIRKLLKNLPERYQEAINLKFFAEMSYEEMALTLELSENNARVLVFRSLKQFQKIYEQYGK